MKNDLLLATFSLKFKEIVSSGIPVKWINLYSVDPEWSYYQAIKEKFTRYYLQNNYYMGRVLVSARIKPRSNPEMRKRKAPEI